LEEAVDLSSDILLMMMKYYYEKSSHLSRTNNRLSILRLQKMSVRVPQKDPSVNSA
jgi:hypothetical protein